MPQFCILRRWWWCGKAWNKFIRKNLVICCVVDCVFYFFLYASLCILWTFSLEWSKCMRWGSVIMTGSDMFFEIFQSINIEIICAVDYYSYYYCCWWWWSFGIEYNLQYPCSRRTRTLSSRKLFVIPGLECIFWWGTIVGVAVAVRSQKTTAMVFCSTRVLAYASYTFNHPFANQRIFIVYVWIPPVFFSWNDISLSFCFFSIFFPKETRKIVFENHVMLM